MAVAGGVALLVGIGVRRFLGFSAAPGFLPGLLGDGSPLLNPLAAVGTAGAFGVVYLGIAATLGVGLPLRGGGRAQR